RRRPRVPRGGGRRGQAAPAAHIVPLGTEEDRREEVDVHGEEGPREEDRLVVVLEGGRGRQRRREVRDAQVGGQEDVGEEDAREEGPGQEDGVAQALGLTGGTGRGDVGRTEAGCRTGGRGTGGRGEGPTRGRVDVGTGGGGGEVGTGGRVLTGGRGGGARARLFLLRSPDGCRPPARRGTRRPPARRGTRRTPARRGTRRTPAAPPPVRTVPVVPRPG